MRLHGIHVRHATALAMAAFFSACLFALGCHRSREPEPQAVAPRTEAPRDSAELAAAQAEIERLKRQAEESGSAKDCQLPRSMHGKLIIHNHRSSDVEVVVATGHDVGTRNHPAEEVVSMHHDDEDVVRNILAGEHHVVVNLHDGGHQEGHFKVEGGHVTTLRITQAGLEWEAHDEGHP